MWWRVEEIRNFVSRVEAHENAENDRETGFFPILRSVIDQCNQFGKNVRFCDDKGLLWLLWQKMWKLWIKIAHESFRVLIPCESPMSLTQSQKTSWEMRISITHKLHNLIIFGQCGTLSLICSLMCEGPTKHVNHNRGKICLTLKGWLWNYNVALQSILSLLYFSSLLFLLDYY
jgi:hypothetical protein